MAITHNLGFPRIGARRELKFALEGYWRGAIGPTELEAVAAELRRQNWRRQRRLDWVPVGDFTLYDHVLDTSFMVGNVPQRALAAGSTNLDVYFRVARGRSRSDDTCGTAAGEMTKWFDTNYHYIVPEFAANTEFNLDPSRLLAQIREARAQGSTVKPVLLGPVTYLWLGKATDQSNRLALLPQLIVVYRELLVQLASEGIEWVQLDEPALVMDLDAHWQDAYRSAYVALNGAGPKILVATYFGRLERNLELLCALPVQGIHLDVHNARTEVGRVLEGLAPHQILSLGVVNGRNVWRTDMKDMLDLLEPLHERLGDRLWIAPSCSLLHVPVDLENETRLDSELRAWLAFAEQKLTEVALLGHALNHGRASIENELDTNTRAREARRASPRVNNPTVKEALRNITPAMSRRVSPFQARASVQSKELELPLFPTTTIGSFPQTPEIRKKRRELRNGQLDEAAYTHAMREEIRHAVREQEALGLDVLVHGEAERNDMVEYFGEQLEGYAFSELGWVQSYGSRCVKPPILYGDIHRPKAMTVEWIRYAQSLTDKPVKGMLTGPVTILNWSFVRDDQPRAVSCYQLALAIREEVRDLEAAGVRIIQIDEAALREGLPLRRSERGEYLQWAVDSFKVAANGVSDATQIHTHMCYSEFNDIIEAIAAMDTDVITIETSRSNMELLEAFDRFEYPNQIGPGVYDIHSPNIPTEEQIVTLMQKAAARIPKERLWVNPDCGLKTRTWAEVLPALENMVNAARTLRTRFG